MTEATSPAGVFITGALGFIGRVLAIRWRAAGVEVRGVDRQADSQLGVVAGDVARPGSWQHHAAGCELFVHTAALVSNAADLATAWEVNVLGTRCALDAAARGAARRFIQLSSVRAFSDLDFPDDVAESWPVRTDGNPYVDAKVASEQVALQAHAGGEVPVTVIRPGDVYGPGSRPWTILPVEAIRSGRFVLPAWGRGIFSPVYVENLVDGILLAAGSEAAAGQVITISDGAGVSTREFFGYYARMLGRRPPLRLPTGLAAVLGEAAGTIARRRGIETEASAATLRYLARTGTYSIAKARALLGYEPAIDLADGMQLTEGWLREEGML